MIGQEPERVVLSAALIEAFAAAYISPQYDEAAPTPQFHRDGWALYCAPTPRAGVAAPRGHAKSTALTTTYMLAELLFKSTDYAILVSSNEEMAIELLGDITRELTDNEDLIRDFGIKRFITSAKTDIIVECIDGHQFRVIARGSGQKMRGRKWRGKRPGLIVCDDLEDDEQVENKERRDKFRRWFYRALLPAMRKGGRVRIHGTILHEDALLARLMKDKSWNTLFYRAHAAFDDFSDILWPEQFSEARLRDIRQSFIEQFDAAGYSQEMLNDPFDNDDSFLRKDDFLPMKESDFDRPMHVNIGADFAVSKKDKANRTSFTVGGSDASNLLHVFDQHVDRWDTEEIAAKMIELERRYRPAAWFVEDGVIWKSIEPWLNKEMLVQDVFLNCVPIMSIKDKKTNARSLQKRMKAGAVRFNKEAAWYAAYEAELLRFTGDSDAVLDDQLDSTAILSRGVDTTAIVEEEDFLDDEEILARKGRPPNSQGRSATTGY